MAVRTASDREMLRLRIMLGVMLSAFLMLGYMLWRIQVRRGHLYKEDIEVQSVRRVRLPAMRGRIYDRAGRALAENQPGFGLAVYLEELRRPGPWSRTVSNVVQTMKHVETLVGAAPQMDEDDIRMHIRKRLPLPLVAWKDLSEESVARWIERGVGVRGVDLHIEAERVYPETGLAAHVVGYVGRADLQEEVNEPFDYYLPEMSGRAGIEKRCNDILRGQAGGLLVRVDVSGFRHEDRVLTGLRREPVRGIDVRLAIDRDIQRHAEACLEGRPGAVVVLNPRNGDVLAMTSRPAYDPNHFVPYISSERWAAYMQNPDRPLFHRAVAGGYTPGSIFKPVVAIAGLENRRVPPEAVFDCPGYFQLNRARFNCWYKPGHGELDLVHAIKHSCNVYFMKFGLDCGYEYIYHMADAFGLGRKTGIDLEFERSGLLPNDRWKMTYFNDHWRDGDTCNASIGQGALVVTPIQMAVYTAALANGGRVLRPRLILSQGTAGGAHFKSYPVREANRLNLSEQTLALVREGMRRVIMDADGTGHRAWVDGVTAAGKTGTAEYGPKEEGKLRGWMIAYAPFERPRYAVALVVDDALSGGYTAAPCMARLLRGLFMEYEKAGGQG